MHRIDTPTAQKDKFGQGKNGFTRGNPQTGTLATKMDPLYFDAIQEEIANVIELAGIALNKEKHDQLKLAIQKYVKNGQIKLNSATNSDSETEASTPLAVKKTYDLASLIIDTFRPMDGESVIFSPDKMYYAVVRNDGSLGLYNSHNNHMVWSVGLDGGLYDGYVNTDKIPGLNQFITQTNNNIVNTNNVVATIADRFKSTVTESQIYSENKRYILTVRNDGVAGIWDEVKNNFVWYFTKQGLLDGQIHVSNVKDLDQFVKDRATPVGVPLPWPQITPPPGYFECNGAPFNKNNYPKLAYAYPSSFLPDLRGEFIRGWDSGRGVDPGRGILSWQIDAIRNIWGSIYGTNNPSHGFIGDVVSTAGTFRVNGVGTKQALPNEGGATWGCEEVVFDPSIASPVSHDNHPRNVAFMYIVKAE